MRANKQQTVQPGSGCTRHQQHAVYFQTASTTATGCGHAGIAEIPGGATLDVDVELLSIKSKSPFGYQVKLVEG
jgi:hypothetical protein